MMQALLQRELGESYIVESAGIWERASGARANARSIMVMEERGIDLTPHIGRSATEVQLTDYSHVICVDDEVADHVRGLLPSEAGIIVVVANAAGGGIPDPYELGIEGYRACLALLDEVMPSVAFGINNSTA